MPKLKASHLPWLLLFIAACVADFFASWAKEIAIKKLKGNKPNN